MRLHRYAVAVLSVLAAPVLVQAQILYSQNFDVDDTANWTFNNGPQAPDIGAGPDPTNAADYFFDYSTVGIPSAPNSQGGTTRGLKLEANNDINFDGTGIFSGASTSPTGLNLSGNYRMTFDWWANTIGPMPTGGSGSTQLTTFGIGTTGTNDNCPACGAPDGVYFGVTGDGNSSVDYRAYALDSQVTFTGAPWLPDTGVYPAGNTNTPDTRNAATAYYAPLGGNTPPAAQTTIFASQTGTTGAGSPAFKWWECEIVKDDDSVDFSVGGLLIASLPLDRLTLTGGNIMFGQGDINAGSSADAARRDLLFGLIDNVVVEALDAPGLEGDHNGDGSVDAADYVLWRKDPAAFGGDPGGYDAWEANFGESSPGSGGRAVPEPAAAALAAISLLIAGLYGRRRGCNQQNLAIGTAGTTG